MAEVCVISVYVPDMKTALDFYTNVLGFKVEKQYGAKIVSLRHNSLPFILEEKEDSPPNNGGNKGVVLALKTENIEQTVQVLKLHQVEFIVDRPTPCPPGQFISFQDPFGNILEYLQFD